MILSQMQTAVKEMVGNIDSSSIFYKYIYPTAGLESQSVINIGANDLVRVAAGPNAHNADLFPELDNTWTVGPTVAGSNIIPRPIDCIVVTNVSSAQASGVGGGGTLTSPGDWSTIRENPVNFAPRSRFAVLAKDSTITGYARIFTRKGKSIIINPTPTTAFLDYLRFDGLKKESLLVNSTDELFMDSDFHDLAVRMAAYLLLLKMTKIDDAAAMLGSVNAELVSRKNFVAEEEFKAPLTISVDGMPTRMSVYGE